MPNLGQDTHSLTGCPRLTSALVGQLQQTRRPLLLTANGRTAVVVQGAGTHQQLLDRLRELETGRGDPQESNATGGRS